MDANMDLHVVATTVKQTTFTAGAITVLLASVFLTCHQTNSHILQFKFCWIPEPLPPPP